MSTDSEAALTPLDLQKIEVVLLAQLSSAVHPFRHIVTALSEDYANDEELPFRYSFAWHHLNRGRYAERALRTGVMDCIDPFDGSLRRAVRAHVLCSDWLGIVYHFEGVEPYALVTSSFDQAKLGLYFPLRKLFVAGAVDSNWVTIGRDTVRALCASEGRVSPWEGPAGTVIYLGFCNNLRHAMWNDLSGLEAAINDGQLSTVDSVVVGPHSFFPIEEIFPELVVAGIPVIHWTKPLPPSLMHSQGSLPLRLAGNRITRGLRRRIISWALKAEHERLASLSDLNGAGLNLWCNLRRHNKSWIDQAEGIVSLVKAISRTLRGRQLRLLLDGTPDTTALAAHITRLLNIESQNIQTLDATQVPLSRSITLCGLVDLHLCVVGSGLTLPHWVMGRRGIAHSNRAHLSQQQFWNNVSEGTHDVDFVASDAVQDMEEPATPDRSYVNYKLDLGAVLQLLITRLQQTDSNPRRSGFSQMQRMAALGRYAEAAEYLINC